MLQRAPKITQDELDAAVEEARMDFVAQDEKRPVGAYTIEEWSAKLGIGITTMRVKMKRAIRDGLYEKLLCYSRNSRGQMYPIPIYRKVKQASNAKVDRI